MVTSNPLDLDAIEALRAVVRPVPAASEEQR